MQIERNKSIDIAKAIGIFLVVFTHNPTFLSGTFEKMRGVITYVGAFHMPLFFFVYGVVYEKRLYGRFQLIEFIHKKVKGLVIPYFIWALIYGNLNSNSIKMILYGTNLSLGTVGSNSALWFFPTMFLTCIFYQLYLQSRKKSSHKYLIAILFSMICLSIGLYMNSIWMPYGHAWGINISFIMCIFMILGNIIKPAIDVLNTKIYLKMIFILSGVLINAVISNINADRSVGGYIVAYGNYGKNIFVFILNATIMCIVIILFATFFTKIRWVAWIGKYSIVIMVLHYFLFEYTVPIASYIVSYNVILGVFFNTILVFIFSIPFICLFKRYCPQLIGK